MPITRPFPSVMTTLASIMHRATRERRILPPRMEEHASCGVPPDLHPAAALRIAVPPAFVMQIAGRG